MDFMFYVSKTATCFDLYTSAHVYVCVCMYVSTYVLCIYINIYIYIYVYCAVLKRLATPSKFHIPLPSTVPFAHP